MVLRFTDREEKVNEVNQLYRTVKKQAVKEGVWSSVSYKTDPMKNLISIFSSFRILFNYKHRCVIQKFRNFIK